MLQELKIVTAILKDEKLLCFPTETVYALSCLAESEAALKKIYQLKNRDHKKPLSIMLNSTKQITKFAIVDSMQKQKIITYYAPGPVTFILPLAPNTKLPSEYFSKNIGIRIPNHPLALAILEKVDKPIIATSVNCSGSAAAKKAIDIPKSIMNNVELILEDDSLVFGVESTIIDLTNKIPRVLRGNLDLLSENL